MSVAAIQKLIALVVGFCGVVAIAYTAAARWYVVEHVALIRVPNLETRVGITENAIESNARVSKELADRAIASDEIEKAAKAARNTICKALREAGTIRKGECPPLEP